MAYLTQGMFVRAYQKPQTDTPPDQLLDPSNPAVLTPSARATRLALKAQANRATSTVMKQANNLAAGADKDGEQVRGWKNLCSAALWGMVSTMPRTSGAKTVEAYELWFLTQEGNLDRLRATARELANRFHDQYGYYLTAQVALDVMTLRILDETWDGAEGEILGKDLLATSAILKELGSYSGWEYLRVRFATDFEDATFAVDLIVENMLGEPVIGWQVKNGPYFVSTARRQNSRFHRDKVKNIKANNLWLETNPTALSVRYLDTADIKAGILRSIKNGMFLRELKAFEKDSSRVLYPNEHLVEVVPADAPPLLHRTPEEGMKHSSAHHVFL